MAARTIYARNITTTHTRSTTITEMNNLAGSAFDRFRSGGSQDIGATSVRFKWEHNGSADQYVAVIQVTGIAAILTDISALKNTIRTGLEALGAISSAPTANMWVDEDADPHTT